MLSENELQRYERQIRLNQIGVKGQEKLKLARILVIGAGGLGSPVLQYLCAAGIGNIGIVDYDVIELSNLNRQVLYNVEDLDYPKALRAEERLRLTNPEIEVRNYFQKFNKDSAIDIIAGYDIVVDCTDQFPTRYLINDACVILDKPVVYGAIHQFEGQVTVFNYQGGPTLRCLEPVMPHHLEAPACAETGVIGTIAGIIGVLQANEVIKLILGIGEVLSGKIMVFNSLTCSNNFFHLERDLDASNVKELTDYDNTCLSDGVTVPQISPDELSNRLAGGEDILIIDVSDPASGYTQGFPCLKIPSYQIIDKVNLIPRDKPVVFICPLGLKSSLVANYLQNKEGYQNVYYCDIGSLRS
jgi:adenylyltransferase/sulfurtransferase